MSPAVGPEEARIERTEHSAAAAAGWFVLNLARTRWMRSEEVAGRYGASAPEETDEPRFAHVDWEGEFTLVRATWPL